MKKYYVAYRTKTEDTLKIMEGWFSTPENAANWVEKLHQQGYLRVLMLELVYDLWNQ